MTASRKETQKPDDVEFVIEREGKQRVKVQSAQLREIGEQLRGRRRFSVFNSIVLPALVTLLTTILTSSFQYVSWRNSVSLQNANDIVAKATEAYEASAETFGKRRYATFLFAPAMRDIASVQAFSLAGVNPDAKSFAVDVSPAAANPAPPPLPESGGSLSKLDHQLLSGRFESYYQTLKAWNEVYDKLLTDIDYHLDRPIFVQANQEIEPQIRFATKIESVECRGKESPADELRKLQLNPNSLKLHFEIIRHCFNQLNRMIDEKRVATTNGLWSFDQRSVQKVHEDLWYIHVMANEFRCYALHRIDFYKKQKELSIVGATLVRSLMLRNPESEEANRHFAETQFRCRREARPT